MCRSEALMSLLISGALLSAIMALGAVAVASRDGPDGFSGA
jgi:hypothetical protein